MKGLASAAFTAADDFDPALGRALHQIGAEASSMHKCQGMSQLLPLPAALAIRALAGRAGYRLHDTVAGGVNREDRDPFDGVDTAITSLTAFAGADAPPC